MTKSEPILNETDCRTPLGKELDRSGAAEGRGWEEEFRYALAWEILEIRRAS